MPSEHSPADRGDRREFPAVVEAIGEDPARWLDAPWDERADMIAARIRGIDEIAVARAWVAVERRLGRGEDGEPREHIIERLETRLDELEQNGERPSDEELATIAATVRADHPEWDEPVNVEIPPREDRLQGETLGVGTDRYQRDDGTEETTEASGLDDWAVAADGGGGE